VRAESPEDWPAVGPDVLAATRGGFTTPGGLEVSLGIERVLLVNGAVVARSSLQLADLGKLGSEQAQQTRDALSQIKLLQNGPDNMAASALAGNPLGATVIQNSLNGQQIDSRTVINSTVNSIGMLTNLNFQASLGDAIARAALSH